MPLQRLNKEVRDEVDFLHADKHQSFLQVDFNTLGIKVFYKLMLSLLMDMIKHSQSTKRNKFGRSLHYLEKQIRDRVAFVFYCDKKIFEIFYMGSVMFIVTCHA